MTDTPFLLAVICRGEPVFEIGYRMECPECQGRGSFPYPEFSDPGVCSECESTGHWWITNFGWRARPYWSQPVSELFYRGALPQYGAPCYFNCESHVSSPPEGWPDLFASPRPRPSASSPDDLLKELGL